MQTPLVTTASGFTTPPPLFHHQSTPTSYQPVSAGPNSHFRERRRDLQVVNLVDGSPILGVWTGTTRTIHLS